MQVVGVELPSSLYVRSMNSVTVKIETKGHRGPLQLSVKHDTREKADIKVSVHMHPKVNFDEYIHQFEDKRVMVMRPQNFFDERQMNSKQKNVEHDKNAW